MKPFVTKYLLLILLLFAGGKRLLAQCPSVLAPQQSFCDIQIPTIASLNAVNNGGGIAWYLSPTTTTPLPPNTPLVNGTTYYAGDTNNVCENRPGVTVTIYGAPSGLNFQGVCVENLADATLSDLIVIGNDIKWYTTPNGGTPLPPNAQIENNTVYFASQTNPDTGCETSRLAVFVNVRLVAAPSGEPEQSFCYNPTTEIVTVANLVVNVPIANWYLEEDSSVPLTPNIPLIDGHTYYASTVSFPCESTGRFPVTVHLYEKNNAGSSTVNTFCQSDITPQNPIINLFNLLGGNPHPTGHWSGEIPTSNGYLGSIDLTTLTIDAIYNFTYIVDHETNCEPDSATVQVRIKPLLHSGTSNQLEICINENTYDLFELLGPNAQEGGFWTPQLASGTNIFNPQVDAIGVYTYSFADSCSDSATITVSYEPILSAGQNNAIEICPEDTNTYDLFTLLNGNPDPGGIWTPELSSGTSIFNPQIDPAGVYTYSFDDDCNLDSATITITHTPLLNAGDDNNLIICGNDTNTYDLFELLGENADIGGVWTPALTSGTSIFNPQMDPAGVYTYSFDDNCNTDTANITVTFAPYYSAGQDNSIEICPNDTNTYDLFTLLGGNPDQGGVWTPPLASGTSIFNPQIDSAGEYTYSFEECPSSASVTITFTTILNPGENHLLEICPQDTTLYNLFDFLGPNADLGGIWMPPLASGTGIFDPQIDPIGQYTYSFSDGCNTDISTITISLVPVLHPGEDNSLEICGSDTNNYDLFALLGPNANQGGIWTPALASGTNIFNPQIDSAGEYTYSFNDNCNTDTATITITFLPAFNTGESATLGICADDDTTYDLFELLGGNPDEGGFWTPALASGTSIFDSQIDPIGVYTYSFIDNCNETSSTVTVFYLPFSNPGEDGILEICPNDTNTYDLFNLLEGNPTPGGIWTPALASGTSIYNPQIDTATVYTYSFTDDCNWTSSTVTITYTPSFNAGQDNELTLCPNDTNTYDLFALLGNSADEGGIWAPPLASGNSIFNPQIDAVGIYTYSFNDACSNSATITISISPSLNPGDDNTLQICQNDTNTYDLFSLLGDNANQGGIWTPQLASGTSIFNPQVDPVGVYTYSFSDECNNESAAVTISYIPSLNAGNDNELTLCPNDTNTYDLFALLGDSADEGGIWTPPLASGNSIFNPQIDTVGVYTYSFNDACSDSATITISVSPSLNPGDDNTLQICQNDTNTYDLFSLLGANADQGGIWTPQLASGTSIFNPQVDPVGVYTYSFSDGCNNDSATITITTYAPSLNAGEDNELGLCQAETNTYDLFALLGGNPDAGGIWTPPLASGTSIFDPQIDAFGVYTYSFSDDCSDSATITIFPLPNLSAGEDNTLEICQTETEPYDLFTILGGNPSPGGIWTPPLTSGSGIFDPQVDPIGVYTYSFNDNCNTNTATVTISYLPSYYAGESNVIEICPDDTNFYDMFTFLGGNADPGGIWTPPLTSGGGIFNLQLDSVGVYTYAFAEACSSAATITIVLLSELDPGEDSTLEICTNDTNTYDLFTLLGGTPDTGGVWTPALASGTGFFNPQVDAIGVYSYSFPNTCSDSATITISLLPSVNPGEDNTLNICLEDTNTYDLFTLLGESAEEGGVWTPELASGTSIFDPQIDPIGTYTYSFADTCSGSATITISLIPDLSAGEDNTLEICDNDTNTYDLFSLLGGNPDTGGIWTPQLTSGTNMFNPQLDTAGSYTYSFEDGCNLGLATITIQRASCITPIDELLIPDGFSPNDDGINDFFEIRNIRTLYPNFKIEIYNRYGNLLFIGDKNTSDWDGTTHKGIKIGDGKAPAGVYFYILYFNDGQRGPKQGRLYLSR